MEEEKSGPPNDKEELRGPSKCFSPLPLPRGRASPKLGWVEQKGEARREERGRARQGLVVTAGKGREELEEGAKERKTRREAGWRGECGGKAEEHPLQIPLARLCGERRVLSPLLIDILPPLPAQKIHSDS